MAARIFWTAVERSTNAAGNRVAHRNFDIQSHDGHVAGRVIVSDGTDVAVVAETESRLRLLLRDALNEIERG